MGSERRVLPLYVNVAAPMVCVPVARGLRIMDFFRVLDTEPLIQEKEVESDWDTTTKFSDKFGIFGFGTFAISFPVI